MHILFAPDEGYDFYYCTKLDAWGRDNLYNHEVTGVDFVEGLKLENIEILQATYVIFETKDAKKPTRDYEKMLNERIQILMKWLPIKRTGKEGIWIKG